MKSESLVRSVLTITLLGFSLLAIADTDERPAVAKELIIKAKNVIIPETDITLSEKTFTYDWNNSNTIRPNKDKISKLESVVKQASAAPIYPEEEELMGKLLYRLGTYYIHASRNPDRAIEKMTSANTFLKDQREKAWNSAQLAYAYELRYAAKGNEADKQKAMDYSNRVILSRGKTSLDVAFAYCVQGLVANDTRDYAKAETQIKKALSIYETIPGGKDDQYRRTQTTLASIMLQEDGHEPEALAILKEQNDYWQSKHNYNSNPDAAVNLFALAQAYLKNYNASAARDELNKGIAIYQTVYGANSPKLVDAYDMLADSYNILGDEDQEVAYLDKANALDGGKDLL